MKGYWDELMGAIGVPAGRGDALFAEIMRRYAEPHRHYHTRSHLAQIFELFEENRLFIRDPAAVIGAIFFHDVIYDPVSAKNEDESALHAVRNLAALGAPVPFCARVAHLIRMTASHKPARGDDDAALFLDMDMAILGAPAAAYDRYAQQVRMEFEPHFGPQAYIHGRLQKFIAPVLATDRIFMTPLMHDRYEAQARINIQREKQQLLDRLANQSGPRFQQGN